MRILWKEEANKREISAMAVTSSTTIAKPIFDKMGKYDYTPDLTHAYSEYKSMLKERGAWDDVNTDNWTLLGIRNSVEKSGRRNRQPCQSGGGSCPDLTHWICANGSSLHASRELRSGT